MPIGRMGSYQGSEPKSMKNRSVEAALHMGDIMLSAPFKDVNGLRQNWRILP